MTACIGTNFNNDGTALYMATAALFMAQALGYQLSMPDQVLIVLTTLVASVGAGGIPSGSFVTMPLIFAAVRLPADKIPILLTVDWLLDRCRTTSNVLGDMTVAVLLDRVSPPDQDAEGRPAGNFTGKRSEGRESASEISGLLEPASRGPSTTIVWVGWPQKAGLHDLMFEGSRGSCEGRVVLRSGNSAFGDSQNPSAVVSFAIAHAGALDSDRGIGRCSA